MAYQSLYRRFRPQRFGEVRGQDHLVAALQNAIRDDRVGHAYLLSGPRGTGKTTSARLLAKALNCTNLGSDGEPCTACDACHAVENGTSMDLVELDAASNNGVEAIRELVASASLGSPGRKKVYILDEVHMLTAAASNALLKTLEEPPGHVVFVLATTDPQKVLATIRSRTQHVELSLIGAAEMAEHVRDIAGQADIEIDDQIVDYVVRKGGGSARDTLSALDQVVAAGGIATDKVPIDDLLAALSDKDPGAALVAVASAVSAGADARELVESLTRHLRDLFLVQQQAPPPELPETALETLREQGSRLGAASTVRALETLGAALVDARQASDPRLVVEVALVKLTAPAAGGDVAGLVARIDALEARIAAGVPAAAAPSAPVAPAAPPPPRAAAPTAPAHAPPGAAPPPPPRPGRSAGGVSAARAALAGGEQSAPAATSTPAPPVSPSPAPATPAAPPAAAGPFDAPVADVPVEPPPTSTPSVPATPAESPAVAPATPAPGAGSPPSITQLRDEWSDVLSGAPGIARALLGSCEIDAPEPGTVRCHLPNAITRDKCKPHAATIERLLSERYGAAMHVELLADGDQQPAADTPGPTNTAELPADDSIDPTDLTDAPAAGTSGVDRLTAAFPGAKVVEDDHGGY